MPNSKQPCLGGFNDKSHWTALATARLRNQKFLRKAKKISKMAAHHAVSLEGLHVARENLRGAEERGRGLAVRQRGAEHIDNGREHRRTQPRLFSWGISD